MAVSLQALKCPQCAGRLIYSERRGCMECDSCGFLSQIKEEYDGLHTIKSVVRQALNETAYRRFDGALRQISECEQIDPSYVGTIIARIAYEMLCAATPGACQPHEAKNLFARLKQDYSQLKSMGNTPEETLLYDSLDSADAFATLALVYDTLGDTGRRDNMLGRTDPKAIFSQPTNMNLLGYALKTGNTALADGILSNTSAIIPKEALKQLLRSYPDGAKKAENAAQLLKTADFSYDEKSIIEDYLFSAADCAATKCEIAVSALEQGMTLATECVINHVAENADPERAEKVVSALCARKLSDEEVGMVLRFAFSRSDATTAGAVLDCLANGVQYVVVPPSYVTAMLSSKAMDFESRMSLLERVLRFRIGGNKGLDSVFSDYLLSCPDSPEERMRALSAVMAQISAVPTAAVEKYLLESSIDGAQKTDIVRLIFNSDINLSLFNDLLGKYITASRDPQGVKDAVSDILAEKGLRMDAKSFAEYIGCSEDGAERKLSMTRRLLENGSRFQGWAVNSYLANTAAESFSSELLSLILPFAENISVKALVNFLFAFRDSSALKAQHFSALVNLCSEDLTVAKIRISHLGNNIECSLLQAYVLLAADEDAVACSIADILTAAKIKINAEMNVGGSPMKLKKYALANKAQLSPITDMLCNRYKVYTMLF